MASLTLNMSVVGCEVMEKGTVGVDKRLGCMLVLEGWGE